MLRRGLTSALAVAAATLLLGALAAHATAAPKRTWAGFEPPSPSYPGESVTRDVLITMDDGVVLSADVTAPALADGSPAPGRFPVIIEQTPYSKALAPATRYANFGYVYVLVDVRGTGTSDGAFGVLDERERRDGRELVAWAARQPWSTGRVGVTGFSYMGASANRTVEKRPKALKAAFVGGSPTDIYREFMTEGGVWSRGAVLWNSLANFGSDPAGTFREQAMEGMESGALNWDLPRWRERSVDVSRYRTPTMVYTGWEDLFFSASPRQYRDMELKPGRKQLVIGPWTHYSSPKSIGPENRYVIGDLELAWFDHWLKGERNGVTDLGPVTLFDQGVDRWRRYSDWPVPRTRYRRLYLSGHASGSAVSLNDGSLTKHPERGRGNDGGLEDPDAGACSRSLIQYSAGSIPASNPCNLDQRPEEDTALTYTTPPLPADLHLNGPISLTLQGKSTAADPLWVARISDVEADGNSVPITQGSLLASRRALDRKRSVFAPNGDPVEPFYAMTKPAARPTKPGRPVKLRIGIQATDWVIEKGHRLRLTIQGADVGHFQPSASSGEQLGTHTVVRRRGEPSYLTLGTTK